MPSAFWVKVVGGLIVAAVLAVVAWGFSTESRLTVLETKYDGAIYWMRSIDKRLDRIEDKINGRRINVN